MEAGKIRSLLLHFKSEIPLFTQVEKFNRQLDIQDRNSGDNFRSNWHIDSI